MDTPWQHTTVLLSEAVDALDIQPDGTYVDATFGRGGHSRALLAKGARVIALDVDPEAEVAAKTLATEVGTDRFCFHRANFGQLAQVMEKEGPVDGLLLDLGISSPQVDQAERGFSFQQDGPIRFRNFLCLMFSFRSEVSV